MKKIVSVFLAIVIALLIRNYYVQAYKIPSGAMMPTLLPGDHIFISKSHYMKNPITRGDIVVFPFPKDKNVDFIKRIIGLPGESIHIKGKDVFVDEVKLEENYTIHTGKMVEKEFGPFTVPDNTVFLMGDNRNNSYDSRFWGTVPIADIKGKATRIYWSIDNEKKRRKGRFWKKIE